MPPSRRSVLTGTLAVSVGISGCIQWIPCLDDVACFHFRHFGADDTSDKLKITHTGGDNLSANEVYITNVVIDYETDRTGTVAWSELDDDPDPTTGINGETIRVDILFPDVVHVLWRHDGQEEIIGETRQFR